MSEEIDQELERKKDEYLAKKKVGNVTINIVGQKPKDETPTVEEFEKTALTEDGVRTVIRAIKKEYEEAKLQEAIDKESNVKFGDKGAGGEVGLRPEDLARESGRHSNDTSFGSHAELVSFLKEQIRKGDESAKKTYSDLVKKCVRGLKEKQLVIKDNDPNEPSFIQNALNERNKKLRRRGNRTVELV